MAIGIASDPRYKIFKNYTGDRNAIEKVKKGLASHPQKSRNPKLKRRMKILKKSMNYITRHFLMQCNTHMTMQRKSWVLQ